MALFDVEESSEEIIPGPCTPDAIKFGRPSREEEEHSPLSITPLDYEWLYFKPETPEELGRDTVEQEDAKLDPVWQAILRSLPPALRPRNTPYTPPGTPPSTPAGTPAGTPPTTPTQGGSPSSLASYLGSQSGLTCDDFLNDAKLDLVPQTPEDYDDEDEDQPEILYVSPAPGIYVQSALLNFDFGRLALQPSTPPLVPKEKMRDDSPLVPKPTASRNRKLTSCVAHPQPSPCRKRTFDGAADPVPKQMKQSELIFID